MLVIRRQNVAYISRWCSFALISVVFAAMSGCAHKRVPLWPVAPTSRTANDDGSLVQTFDTDQDGVVDHAEVIDQQGRLRLLRYDLDQDGTWEKEIDLADIDAADCRDLVIVMDSIPYQMVEEFHQLGRFSAFYKPARTIAPFPVMTELCLGELFHTSPAPGIEAEFFDGERLVSGYQTYLGQTHAPWSGEFDYSMRLLGHAFAYLDPLPWAGHEMLRFEGRFADCADRTFIAYGMGTSALGSRHGRNGHAAGLVHLDRLARQIMFKHEGKVRITLMSDHGHAFDEHRRLKIRQAMGQLGYDVQQTLENVDDVVIPVFGLVTCAAIHTLAPERVARDAVNLQGVEIAACIVGDQILVFDRNGSARIEQTDGGLRYQVETSDPLQLQSIVEEAISTGLAAEDGSMTSDAWLTATANHLYPDAVYRLWRGFHGLIVNTPEVLLSLEPGWYVGNPDMDKWIILTGAHGNLRQASSYGFLMTTAGELPSVIRADQVADTLRTHEVDLLKHVR